MCLRRVTYLNASGTLLDAHTVLARDRRAAETVLKTERVVLATGGRPRSDTHAQCVVIDVLCAPITASA